MHWHTEDTQATHMNTMEWVEDKETGGRDGMAGGGCLVDLERVGQLIVDHHSIDAIIVLLELLKRQV